jgi:hypothetical protein
LTFPGGEQDEQLHGLALDSQGLAVAEELVRSAVKPEVTEMINKAAQGTLLRGGVSLSVAGKRQI